MGKLSNLSKGIICILISGLGFSLMALFVKLAGDLSVMQKALVRNLIAGSIAAIPLIKHLKTVSYPQGKKEWFILFLRSLTGTLGVICYFYSINEIHLADATIIQRISPFILLILSYIFFKERMAKVEFVAVIFAFIGIIFVVKPSVSEFLTPGAAVALLGAFFAGASYTSLRYLGLHGISAEFIVFFFSIFSTVSLLPFVILDFEPMTNYQMLMLAFVGIFGAVGQFGLTYAYKFAAAKSLSVFDYAQIIFSGILGYIFLFEIPDVYSVIGYIIIIAMGVLISFHKNK